MCKSFVAMQKVAVVASVAATSLASSGHMSVLGGSVVDGKCEYADTTNGGAKSPAATSPHVVSGRYCGVSEKMFAGGASCGACYKISYSGEGGSNPGRAGSAVVQVVNQASEDFACHKDVFNTITGATTGIFPITYTEVACEVQSAVGVATVLDGKNAYYTKAIFSDLPHAVSSAKLKIGKNSFPMDRVAGATFKANTDGNLASASFEITLADGSINKLAPCFKSWPVATGSSCAPKASKESVVESKHSVMRSDVRRRAPPTNPALHDAQFALGVGCQEAAMCCNVCPNGYSVILDVNACVAAAQVLQPGGCARHPQDEKTSWKDIVQDVRQDHNMPFGCSIYEKWGGHGSHYWPDTTWLSVNTYTDADIRWCGGRYEWASTVLCQLSQGTDSDFII